MKKLLKRKSTFKNLFFVVCFLFIGIFFVLLSEFVMYVGFIKNNIGIEVKFIVFFSILLAIMFRLITNRFDKKYLDKFFCINNLLLCVFTILFICLFIIENVKYPNFVYSQFSLDLFGLTPIIFISYILWLIGFWRLSFCKVNSKLSFTEELIFYVIGVALINPLNVTFQDAIKKNIFIAKHLNFNYEQKINEQWGLSYRYLMFVKANTEENSLILIPPQTMIWYATGNAGVVRYFLYPRQVHGTGDIYDKLLDPYSYDYILLAWGEWINGKKEEYGWPKEKIVAEKIIYWDDKTNSSITEYTNYDPNDKKNYKAWGIIKIKK